MCGVAYLKNRIILAAYDSKIVKIFSDSPPFSKLRQIVIDNIEEPGDLAACGETRQVFVADRAGKKIWFLRLDAADDGVFEIFAMLGCSPWTISVTAWNQLVVTTYGGNTLFVYDLAPKTQQLAELDGPEGSKYRAIALGGVDAKHAVQSRRDSFVLCGHMASSTECKLISVGLSGATLQTYDGRKGVATFTNVDHLASLAQASGVLVADVDNKCVRLISDKDFDNDRVIVDFNDLEKASRPHRVVYVEEKNWLIVVLKNNTVKVYHLDVSGL